MEDNKNRGTDLVIDETPLLKEGVNPHDRANVAGEVATTSGAEKQKTRNHQRECKVTLKHHLGSYNTVVGGFLWGTASLGSILSIPIF